MRTKKDCKDISVEHCPDQRCRYTLLDRVVSCTDYKTNKHMSMTLYLSSNKTKVFLNCLGQLFSIQIDGFDDLFRGETNITQQLSTFNIIQEYD